MPPRGGVVVAIHDVAPSTAAEVRYLLAALDEIGVAPRVLKVIPNLDGRDDLRRDPALLRLLADEAAAGSEIVLHGYTHRAAGPLRGPWPRRLRAQLFAGQEAEFMTLGDDEMARRLADGYGVLRDAGLEPRGFCAPCWLAPPHLPGLLRRCGLRYYVSMMSLLDLSTGRRRWTPWLGYMGADEAQERLVGLGGRAWQAVAPPGAAIKVFLHPRGATTSPSCRRVLRQLAGIARERRPTTYGALIGA